MEKIYYIYKHTNKINNKVYIGQTSQKDINRRWRDGNGYKDSTKFWLAIQKYGWEQFEHQIIEIGDNQDWANEREIFWIAYYDSYNNDEKGYNMTPGSQNYMSELWQNPDYREKMCKIFSEVRKKSWEDKDFAQAKLKEMLEGAKKFWNDPERRNKRIEDMTGYKNPNSKAVKNIETQKIFSTIKEAAEWCKMNSVSGIGQCCNKQRRTCGLHPIDKYPLHWCYANEDIKVEDIEKDRGKHSNTLKVKCLNNNKIFDNANLAAQWCGLKDGTSIRKCCLNKQKTAGIDPETLQRCEWAYLKGDDLE